MTSKHFKMQSDLPNSTLHARINVSVLLSIKGSVIYIHQSLFQTSLLHECP